MCGIFLGPNFFCLGEDQHFDSKFWYSGLKEEEKNSFFGNVVIGEWQKHKTNNLQKPDPL